MRLGDADFVEDSPGGAFEALEEEAAQGELGGLHGGGFVVLVLAQEQEVLANLVFAERGRIALEMLGELADVADVLLFGGGAVIFKLDQLLELRDRGIVGVFHKPGRMPVSAGNFPAKKTFTRSEA